MYERNFIWLPSFLEEAIMLYISSKEALEIIEARFEREHVTVEGIDAPGLYIYGNESQWGEYCGSWGWTKAEEVIDSYKEKINELQEELKTLEDILAQMNEG